MKEKLDRILIVDDNKQIHQDIKQILDYTHYNLNDKETRSLENTLFGEAISEEPLDDLLKIQFTIDDAYQGDEAVSLVKKSLDENYPYCVVFMDVRIPPGMDGIQTITKVWEIDPNLQIIIITAFSDYSLDNILKKFGRTDNLIFLKKPFDPVSINQITLTLTTKWEAEKTNRQLIENLGDEVEKRTQALDTLQKAQAQLIQSEKMSALGRLVAGIAHEINSPLGVSVTSISYLLDKIKNISALYESKQMKKSDLDNFLSVVEESANITLVNVQKAADLVSSFKRVSADQSSEAMRKFNIKEYINTTLLSLKPKLKNIPHKITVMGDEYIEVNSYPGAFSQIITNLIFNSLIHAYNESDKGNIQFDVSRSTDKIVFIYTDDGKGIPKENLDKIFDPFFTTNRDGGGTGLGLNVIYNIVNETLKGTIQCESEVGVGTKFIITFNET